jgi:hypothetical protein
VLKIIKSVLSNKYMSKLYTWAANPAKLQRAIAKLVSRNGTEAEIKEEYILIGGLVVEPEEEKVEESPKLKKAKKNA